MGAIRCDGNDLLAVYNTVKLARKFCVENNKPLIVEAMTYR
jgi:2-oxoisovalerate dehydrogenase E1 component alpha subunit